MLDKLDNYMLELKRELVQWKIGYSERLITEKHMKKIHKSIKGLKRQKEGQTYMQFKLQEERRENRSNFQRYNI